MTKNQGTQENKEDLEKKISFLQRKNIIFSVKRYGIDALGAMALGLFSSLIVGLILKVIGEQTGLQILIDFGKQAMAMMGPAIGVAVAFGLGAPPLVLFASTITGMAGAAVGGPVGAFVAAVMGAEFGKLVSKETKVDIIITPAVTILVGVAAGTFIGPPLAEFMKWLGSVIMLATELAPIPMGILVSVLMGMILTLPISSAALAMMLVLGGPAAGAATVGCATQMVGFAVASYRENGWGGLVSQGLGTSMLQVPNIVKNPLIWVPATLTSAILGPLATTILPMSNIPAGAGMGTSGLVGQFGTIEAMGMGTGVLIKIGLLHFILPAVLTLVISEFMRSKGWIKYGDMRLDI
ncbi:PTS transporter subunit IIC [Desulfosporosinus sp.]|uniref:PTS transporter subunit IIC n=1 Tax=Desulfosporosinus sp. TaxID=157907 RepID=UPI0025C42BB0|nr:PTS sugar transporter subunit IIC [Desulfosporosinus sp.]MBC2721945.1 PTS sugar transporter subunit IIC [Desulfosporosinus sp.]MBC2728450.1 PTS sugar transporter subunit IIC [Desulfosporosinus sp.]